MIKGFLFLLAFCLISCNNGYTCADTEVPGIYRCTKGDIVAYYDESGHPVDYENLDPDANATVESEYK
jgi:hypothetical protein